LIAYNEKGHYFTKLHAPFRILKRWADKVGVFNKYAIGFNLLTEVKYAQGYTYIGNDHLPGLRRIPKQGGLIFGLSVDF
jgi:hypothetical protein